MSDNIKEQLETIKSTGVHTATKTIFFVDSIDDDALKFFMEVLHTLDESNGRITIKFTTGGGDVAAARGIYDAIRECRNEVHIICYSEVCSSGAIILQAADKRYMKPNSKLMVHTGSEGIVSDHPRNAEKMMEQNKLDGTWMEDILLEKIKIVKKRYTRAKVKELMVWDTYMSPKEAIELGLADEVL